MQCPRCQHENPPGTKFCGECAAPLASSCPSCGAANPPGNKFCGQCAAPLRTTQTAKFSAPESYTPKHLAEKILTSKAALEGERKQVTVLFADLKGSMELLADRDPEEARKLLDPVLEHMIEAVHRYEGTVNQVMGDGIMALFGAPLAHEDHAVRACYAALRMQESVKRYAEGMRREQGIMIGIRVGLNSGDVVVRAIGNDLHMDYTAVGQTTHLAARMEQRAESGTILLAPATLALVEEVVDVAALGATTVKGLATPIQIYQLSGANSVRSRLHAAAARGLTKFTGRSNEVVQLQDALDLARDGKGQIVAVVGDPGVGKSRLFWEFIRSNRTDGCLVIEGASVSYGKATTFLPIVDLLRGYFRIEPHDDVQRIRAKITDKILSLDRSLEPALLPLLALLDIPLDDEHWTRLDPAQRRQRTLAAVRGVLLRESQVQPLVVVVEDLHWIDGETEAVLGQLVQSLAAARLLLLVSYRPEYRHSWGAKTYYRQLRIDALPEANVWALLESLLGTDPSLKGLKELLRERTDGNPFFLEESIRALVGRVLLGERGRYRLGDALETVEMPATAKAIVAARIDRLEPETKRLLQAAAVIGKDVSLPVLEAIVDATESELRQRIADLQAAEFLYETRLFPELEYTFKHALTYEVAYGGVLKETRCALHRRVVEAIERRSADGVVPRVEHLALHAFQAELWERALMYLRRAGAKAMDRGAHREATAFFERALLALERLPKSQGALEQAIDIRMLIGNALMPSGQLQRILALLSEAQDLAAALDDQRRLGRISSFMTVQLWSMGNPSQAIECGTRAMTIAKTLGDFPLEVRTSVFLGQAYWGLGKYREAIDVLTTTVSALNPELAHKRLGLDYLPSVVSRSWLAASRAELGEFDEGVPVAEEAIRIAEAAGNQGALVEAHVGFGFLYLRRGDLATATPQLERGLELCRREDVSLFFTVIAAQLAYAYALGGRSPEALALLEQAEAASREEASKALRAALLSEVLLRDGRFEAAGVAAQHALSIARGRQERGHEAYALRLVAEVHARRDPSDIEIGLTYYHQALALATELSMRPLVAHCHLGLGRLSRRAANAQQAQEHLTTAITMYREMDMRLWLEQAEAEMKECT